MIAPNEDMRRFWNEEAGPRWVRLQARLDRSIEDVGLAAIQAGAPMPGESVLDVGCGCGATLLELARRVGPTGRVRGIDLSEPMLRLARERIEAEGHEQVRVGLADAQTAAFEPEHDLVYSRFGLMFFDDPVAAFANLLRAARPGGRLAFACWQARERNPWMGLAMQAAGRHLELPAASEDPHAPGPFGLHDAARTERILGEAGWVDVALRELELSMLVGGGGSLSEAVDFSLEMGPMPELLAGQPAPTLEAVSRAVREALEPHLRDEGVVLPGSAFVVSARRPGA